MTDTIRFLDIICGNSLATFQTFDDSNDRKDPRLARIFHGHGAANTKHLKTLQDEGAGVFLMINQGDGKGRSSQNVERIRAVFVDLDGSPLQPVLDAEIEAHITVESSPGRYHAYWLVTDFPCDQFATIQKSLAARFNGDKSVNDLPRVMRLPGFLHQKGKPFLTRIISCSPDLPPYSIDEIKKMLPKKTLAQQSAAPDTPTQRIADGRSPKGSQHNDLKAYIVGRRKAGLTIGEIRTLVEKWVRENNPGAKTDKALLEWAEQHIEPDAASGVFSNLVRVKSFPVSWRLQINNHEIEVPTTRELDSYPTVRRLIMEQLGIVPPRRTSKAWNNELDYLMQNLVDEDMPEDVSPMGMAWGLILDFCTGRVQARHRDELILGRPWHDEEAGRVYFTIKSLNKYLLNGGIYIQPRDIGKLLRKHQGNATTLYIKGKTMRLWWLSLEEVDCNRQKEDFDKVSLENSF